MENKRQFTRVLFSIEATLDIEEQTYPVVIHDISLNGALISAPYCKESLKGKFGTLSFQLGDNKTEVTMHISIVHENEYEAGLQCSAVDIDSVIHLRRLIEMNFKFRQ
jgi:hypothetical protein|tara:strand:+ start:318 stop:641 length:324 start_codon:yes stop_codon:yes gene_type:complete